MHVVLDCRYIYPCLSGIGRYALALAEGLASLMGPPDPSQSLDAGDGSPSETGPPVDLRLTLLVRDIGHLGQHLSNDALARVDPVELPWCPRRPESLLRLPRLLRELHADVFHTPDAFAPLRGIQRVCPTVVTIHDLIPLVCRDVQPVAEGGRNSLKARFRFVWATWLTVQSHLATAVLTCSQHSAADLRRCLSVDPHVIYPGVCALPPVTPRDTHAVLARLGLTGRRYVLFVGRPEPYKNIEGLLLALHELGPAFEDVWLVVAGVDDPRFPGPRQLASRLGLRHRLVHTGHVSDAELASLYAGAAALGMVSHYEGFGYPPLEALSVGTPVLASRVTSLPEVLGDAAVYADPRDVADIAQGLCRLLTCEGLRRSLVARGAQRLARLTPRRQALDTLAVYREAVGG